MPISHIEWPKPKLSDYEKAQALAICIVREYGRRTKWDLHRALIDFGVSACDAMQSVRSLIDDGQLIESRGRMISLPPEPGAVAACLAWLDRIFGPAGG